LLTRKSKYGLRAVLTLAEHAGRGPMLVSELANSQCIPKKFLEAILLDLKRSGLLLSKKGKGGGYLLSRPPSDITVGQVIRVLEGPLALVPCASQTQYRRCEECVDEATCGVRRAMLEVRDATSKILDRTTLAALNSKTRKTPRELAPRIRKA
jgi:Rrf2 family protein